MLSWRRRLAQWWIKQAVVAKLIWIVAYTVSLISHIKLSFVPLPIEQPGATLQEVMAGVVLVSTFSAALHLAAAYRATRPDIREFIETTAKP
jgi:hypothetical protein